MPAFWRGLGLPGLFDVHVHFLPPRILRQVCEQFDAAGPLIGRPWPIHYRGSRRGAGRRSCGELGVRRFSALPYAHRPGMAAYLNDWALRLRRPARPGACRSATFYPEPEAAGVRRARWSTPALEVFKVHVQVGGVRPRRPAARRGVGHARGRRHAGGGPRRLGPGRQRVHRPGPARGACWRRHPRLAAVVAHMGAPEYAEFLDARRALRAGAPGHHDGVHRLLRADGAVPAASCCRGCATWAAGKVLLGSDFPNIPYPYAHQLEALGRLDLGDDWLRAVCWDNAAALFNLT